MLYEIIRSSSGLYRKQALTRPSQYGLVEEAVLPKFVISLVSRDSRVSFSVFPLSSTGSMVHFLFVSPYHALGCH